MIKSESSTARKIFSPRDPWNDSTVGNKASGPRLSALAILQKEPGFKLPKHPEKEKPSKEPNTWVSPNENDLDYVKQIRLKKGPMR